MEEDASDFIEIQLRLPGSDRAIFCVRKYHKGTDWYPFWDHERRKLYRVDDPQPNSPDLVKAIDNFVKMRVSND